MEPKSERVSDVAHLDSTFFYNPNYQYRIRKNDKINISILGQDDLSGGSTHGVYNSHEEYGKWLLVDANGNIEIPKTGTFYILDKTIIEVKNILKQRYSKWLVNPIIDVKVLNKEITVLREVIEPKVVNIEAGWRTC